MRAEARANESMSTRTRAARFAPGSKFEAHLGREGRENGERAVRCDCHVRAANVRACAWECDRVSPRQGEHGKVSAQLARDYGNGDQGGAERMHTRAALSLVAPPSWLAAQIHWIVQ